MSLQTLFYIIIFFISLTALVIGCLVFTKKKGEYYSNHDEIFNEDGGCKYGSPGPCPVGAGLGLCKCAACKDAPDGPVVGYQITCGATGEAGTLASASANVIATILPCGNPPSMGATASADLEIFGHNMLTATKKFGPYEFATPAPAGTLVTGPKKMAIPYLSWKKSVPKTKFSKKIDFNVQGMLNYNIAKTTVEGNKPAIAVNAALDFCGGVEPLKPPGEGLPFGAICGGDNVCKNLPPPLRVALGSVCEGTLGWLPLPIIDNKTITYEEMGITCPTL